MHRELLDALSVITEEEQRILDEQRGIPKDGAVTETLSLSAATVSLMCAAP